MRNMPPVGPAGYDDPTWPDAITRPASPQPQPQAQPQQGWQPPQRQPVPATQRVPPVYTPPPYMRPAQGARSPVSTSYAASRALHAVAQVISLVLGIVELLLLVRIVLLFFGANPTAEFTSLIYGWSAPLVAPFQGVFPNAIVTAGGVLDAAAILAMIVYAIGARVAEAVLRMLTRI